MSPAVVAFFVYGDFADLFVDAADVASDIVSADFTFLAVTFGAFAIGFYLVMILPSVLD